MMNESLKSSSYYSYIMVKHKKKKGKRSSQDEPSIFSIQWKRNTC